MPKQTGFLSKRDSLRILYPQLTKGKAEEMEFIISFNLAEYFAWENLYKENKKC